MRRANESAAAAILDAQDWKTQQRIDLHGLFASEAERAVKDFLLHYKGALYAWTGAQEEE